MTDHDFVDKKALSERDICTKFMTPAITTVAGWTLMQFSEELTLEACLQPVDAKWERGRLVRAVMAGVGS
jgi:hypothetical protein